MIEKTLEAKIMAQVVTVVTSPVVQVVGFWQDTATGKVKEDKPPFVRVSCMPRGNSNENIPQFECIVNFEIVSKIDADPKKANFVYWSGQVLDLLGDLVGDLATLKSDTYSEDGVYSVKGFKLDAGDMGWDSDDDIWVCNIPTTFSFCTCT